VGFPDWTGDDRLEMLAAEFFEPTGLRFSVLDGSRFLDVPVAAEVLRGLCSSWLKFTHQDDRGGRGNQ
jgi:hypothetical protein